MEEIKPLPDKPPFGEEVALELEWYDFKDMKKKLDAMKLHPEVIARKAYWRAKRQKPIREVKDNRTLSDLVQYCNVNYKGFGDKK